MAPILGNTSPSLNASNDIFKGGAGTDVFVLGDASGNAYGLDSNPSSPPNYRALINGFDMATDQFQLWDADQSGAVAVTEGGVIANLINISMGGLQIYQLNYADAAHTETLYVAGTTKVVAELDEFTGIGSQLTTNNFSIV